MTTDRGVVHGRVPTPPPQRRGRVHVVALPSLLVAIFTGGVIIASLGAYGDDDDGGRLAAAAPTESPSTVATLAPAPSSSPVPSVVPTPSLVPSTPSPAPTVVPTPSPDPTAVPLAPAASGRPVAASLPPFVSPTAEATPLADLADPFQLARFPGAEVVGTEEGLDGSVSWTLIDYAIAESTQDEVREHYRTVFRETDWFVGDVDFVAGVWTFSASQGDREAQLEISVDDDLVRVSAYITEIEPVATPKPTQRATRARDRNPRRDRNPPRVTRPRPAPNRDRHIPRYRGGDDDDDDDDGGDD